MSIIAGATDVYPAQTTRNAWGDWDRCPQLDISGLEELRGISNAGDHYRIGALTTWADLARAGLPPGFDALAQAAPGVGGVQIQNRATIAGNICNASPAADGVPGLLCLNAAVEICSRSSKRILPLEEFIQGNRKTAIRNDELVSALVIPRPPESARSAFKKLGSRRYLVISIVNVAGLLDVNAEGRIRDARIAVGACSPVARRMTQIEDLLRERKCEAGLVEYIKMAHFETLTPIDDVRADAGYRRRCALELTRRLLTSLIDGSG